MLARSICIVALTEVGKQLAHSLQAVMPNTRILYRPKPFAEHVQTAFLSGEGMLLICAAGIAVRTLAPVLSGKHIDPPVLVMDEEGKYIVPLLSGHQGGANEWALKLAVKIGALPVITTAKDYANAVYTVGMGCERNCPTSVLFNLLEYCLRLVPISIADLHSIASIDIKSDEVGLIRLSEQLNIPYVTYNSTQLSVMEDLLSTKSEYVYEITGVYGVAESAALVAAQAITGEVAELALVKHKNAKATCAIARSYFN